MKRFVLIGLSSLLLSLSVPAIVDTNNDGISDLWERQYNGDQLFDPPIDPAADPDSDGWTNAQEAAAGTNPFDANPPSGFLRPDIINIPAVWEDVNGNPVLVTPNTIRVSWQTIPGKQYTLLYSPDLTASSWLPVEGAYIGNGTITEYNFPLIDPTSNFWRVTIEDVDTDGDGVSDAEEYVYGTNPNNAATIAGIPDLWLASNFPSVLQNGGLSTFDPNADADGDSLTNSEELAAGTNPNSVDTDGDGLNDDEDAVPNDAEINWPKTPETRYVWIPQVATTGAKALSKYGHILFPSNNGGSSNLSALHVLWDSNTSSWVNLTGASSWSGSGFHSGNTPDVFDAEWLHIDDMNDEGVVVGRSKVIGPDVPVAWVLAPAIMKWQISGTALNQYADPIYIVPGFEYVDPWGDLEKALVGEAPRIADDGTVSALSYYVEAGNLPVDIEWVASGAQVASHSKEMTMWANFDLDSNIQYRSGGLIGASGGLLVEHHPSVPKTVLHYRNGANLESLEGLLPSTVYGIDNTDIGRTPPTSESPGGRIWFSVNHDGGNVVFLEKRNGGSGISRWHNIPSMADGAVRINARGEAITRGSSYLTPSATPKIWRNGKYTELNEISSKPSSVTITNAIDLASNGMILAQAVENGVAKTGLLIPVEVKTYPVSQSGPDKAHKLNLDTRQNEKASYGQGWEKCVSKVWATANTVNLIDYLDGGPGNHSVYENAVKWKVNGTAQTSHELSLGSEPSDDSHRHYYIEVQPKSGGDTIDRLIITLVPRSTKSRFDSWYTTEKSDLVWLGELVNLFYSISTVPLPDGYMRRPCRNFNPFLYAVPSATNTRMHPDAYYETRSYATPGGHAHQMCFDDSGILLQSGVSAGSADKAAAFPQNLNPYLHVDADVKPFVWALQLDGTPADQQTTTLSAPIMHEGAYLKKYSECRPAIANSKPILADGATP